LNGPKRAPADCHANKGENVNHELHVMGPPDDDVPKNLTEAIQDANNQIMEAKAAIKRLRTMRRVFINAWEKYTGKSYDEK
jgi:hypothetical protein